MSRPFVLLIDDDRAFWDDLSLFLADEFRLVCVATPEDGERLMAQELPDAVLLDLDFGRGDPVEGLALLERLQGAEAAPPVVVLTGDRSTESVIGAIRAGAFHYVCKPPVPEELRNLLRRATADAILRRTLRADRRDPGGNGDGLVHADPLMARVLERLAEVADTDTTVLLTGESGTGKEVAARWLHANSRRRDGPFVAIHCAAMPETMIESELFGHVRGAFTDAVRDRPGAFEEARGGTLLLDEIGEAPPAVQVKLLRVLENREFRRVGGDRPLVSDVRVICATHRDLEREVAAGRFREDLFYRVSVVRVPLPPLRERPADIPVLAEHFVRRFAARMGKPVRGLTRAALAELAARPWRGNVRQLRNVIERAVIHCRGDHVTLADLSDRPLTRHRDDFDHRRLQQEALQDFERRYWAELMEYAGGNVLRAAELSGRSRQTVYRKLREVGLWERFAAGGFGEVSPGGVADGEAGG